MHTEYFYDRSPDAALNNRNQLEYWGANLWDLEQAPGLRADHQADGSVFQPCPVDNYHTGGFGLIKKYTGARWMGELKSTHLFEAGGHHEIKYGWHPEYVTFDQERWYSGPLGHARADPALPAAGRLQHLLVLHAAAGRAAVRLRPRRRAPATDLLYPPDYQDSLKANVSSLVERVLPAGELQPARRCAT